MGHSCIAETSIEQYSERLMQNRGPQRIPLVGSLELTFRCNHRCVHCYCNKGIDDSEEERRELSHSEVCRILDEIAEAGCLWLLLTGGEPLVRADFKDIYRHAKGKGFLVTLFTNGTLITPPVADFLGEFPPRSIEITLYGMSQETYERVTGSPGSYGKCRRAIDLLLERGLPLRLKTVVTRLNRHEFSQMKRFAKGLGLEFRFDALINERIDHCKPLANLRMSPREVMELDLSDPARGPEFARLFKRAEGFRLDPNSLFWCGAGVNSFHVDPHGRLMPCLMTRDTAYDLRLRTFSKGWQEFLPRIKEQRFTKPTRCVGCDLRSICDQCPGWSQLESGDPEIPVDYLCEITHLRAEAYGIGDSLNG